MIERMGEMMSRRLILSGGLAGIALGLAPRMASAGQLPHLDWEPYLAETRAQALSLIRANRDDIAGYLHFIAARLAGRDDIPQAQLQPAPWAQPAIEFGAHPAAAPFVLIEFRMAPGAYLPPHNHPNASVATLLLDGEAVIDNYELEPGSDPPGTEGQARLRHTQRQLIRPGDANFVQPSRNNLHAFVAGPHGARGVDVSSLHGPSGRFGYLQLGEPPSVGRVIEARWVNPSARRVTASG